MENKAGSTSSSTAPAGPHESAAASGFRHVNDAAAAREWAACMRANEFSRAWAIADRDMTRLGRAEADKHEGPRHQQRIWRGEPFDGRRVLVRCYHGLGDTIQFARFLPVLARRSCELTVWCQAELLPLLAGLANDMHVIPLHDGAPDVDFDVDIEIMEIAHAVRADCELIVPRGPYLTLPPRKDTERDVALVVRNGRSHGAIAVGLVWDVSDWSRQRSVPLELLGRLRMDGVILCSLQRGQAAQGAAAIGAVDISTPDIVELGRRICELDLVICVDTMIAHLAGALWRETWILLNADCDWRWPLSGAPSSWYPTARLFHQPVANAWREAIEVVRSALADRVSEQRCR